MNIHPQIQVQSLINIKILQIFQRGITQIKVYLLSVTKKNMDVPFNYLMKAKYANLQFCQIIYQKYILNCYKYKMPIKSFIALALLFIAVQSNYMIAIKCGYFNCPYGCSLCQVLDGGPFNNYKTCVTSCSASNTFNFSINCGGCETSSSDCSYKVEQAGYYPSTGCTNYDDDYWYSYKNSLDSLYAAATYSITPYQWCSNACAGLATVFIVIIVIAAVGVVAFAAFVIKKRRERQQRLAADLYQKVANNGNSPYAPYP